MEEMGREIGNGFKHPRPRLVLCYGGRGDCTLCSLLFAVGSANKNGDRHNCMLAQGNL